MANGAGGFIISEQGINTVQINGEVKHISEFDILNLSHEWSKLKNELADFYDYNSKVNRGWHGFVLRLDECSSC
ncbi:hypothetical protein AB1287_17575 [Enterobacter asburiae]|uniref:hypothetical protein n=1 Tax=Scandinavium sp. UTDF21-P1B TaxID=3446379 RepID=UPI00349847DE